MARRTRQYPLPFAPPEPFQSVSVAADAVAHGEEVLALIDPSARRRDPERFSAWLSARLTIDELPRILLPPCDARCHGRTHDADLFVTVADLALDPTHARPESWWADWNETLDLEHRSRAVWYAGTPAVPAMDTGYPLEAGTRLRRIASTDPHWVHYDGMTQEGLFRILDGPLRGDSLVAVTFGPSPLLPGLAGMLIAPDHPPARDPVIAVRLLAAGWSAVERGLPYEE